MFSLFEFTNLALVGVTSRRPVIQETVFCAPDLNLLTYSKEGVSISIKMLIVELKNLSSDDLKKRLNKKIYLKDRQTNVENAATLN